MSSAIKDLASGFDAAIRRRGEQYFRQGAVVLRQREVNDFSAWVQGTERYDVAVELFHGNIRYRCSCPYFEDHDGCKHIWATLLQADRENLINLDKLAENPADDTGEDDELEEFFPAAPASAKALRKHGAAGNDGQPPTPTHHAVWKRRLDEWRHHSFTSDFTEPPAPWPAGRQIVYTFDYGYQRGYEYATLQLELGYRTMGVVGKPKKLKLRKIDLLNVPDEEDRQILTALPGCANSAVSYYGEDDSFPDQYLLSAASHHVVRQICATGRAFIKNSANSETRLPLAWDGDGQWRPVSQIEKSADGKSFVVSIRLKRGGESLELNNETTALRDGFVVHEQKIGCLDTSANAAFLEYLGREEKLMVPGEKLDDLLVELTDVADLPPLELPPDSGIAEIRSAPRPRLTVRSPSKKFEDGTNRLPAEVAFDYEQVRINAARPDPVIFDAPQRRLIYRDLPAEDVLLDRLGQVGFKQQAGYFDADSPAFRIAPQKLTSAVRVLTAEGWHVEAEGKLYRQAGEIRMDVSSGIDWFELKGSVDFGSASITLPKLLKALAKGERTVTLDDGTIGIVPEEWLKKYGLLATLGETEEESIKFSRGQVGILDALLAAQPNVTFDQTFAEAKKNIANFNGVTATDPPESFVGKLRPYQCEGLGWFGFLRRFALGGCLADDMGLGKTVQVLALLEERRLARQNGGNGKAKSPDRPPGPSLVVVPRSLIFNWKEEATRFTPQLRILDHATTDRLKSHEHFADYDVILTTYGTLRNDAAIMTQVPFDYVILDEAQAIKNAASESAKAARLLRGRHRLVLSGTPVQNHLGELWSLFEFLNPGMLGAGSAFSNAAAAGRNLDEDSRKVLSHALRPFILRRTKEQVATELPAKMEETLYCELDKTQRAQYDELRDHYRQSLLGAIAADGINAARFQILEALLRLRQAACHPGLIDKSRTGESSAKLETLLDRLAELAEEDHKVLVFSQFTSMLAIVRARLDEQHVIYEYLDGKTRDRQSRVHRFQTDPACKVFLISLKAGGLGLNLTAAQYVFLLDPWWNPAIEMQAIDRAHRIGQTKSVFAYRLIAKDTVEEKVIQLQKSKRDLADAIINADNSLISKMGKAELELLLS